MSLGYRVCCLSRFRHSPEMNNLKAVQPPSSCHAQYVGITFGSLPYYSCTASKLYVPHVGICKEVEDAGA